MIAACLLALQQAPAFYDVPLSELELAPGSVLPLYEDGPPWWAWDAEVRLPWAVLDGPGEVVFAHDMESVWPERPGHVLGELLVRTDSPRDVSGTLFLPRASGGGFARNPFRIPASRATSNETDFRRAELERYHELLRARVPGGAWFRHRSDELRAALGPEPTGASEPADARPEDVYRPHGETYALFSGGRALYENLQLERGLPVSPAGEELVALSELEGIEVREIDWRPLLAGAEPELDPLAALVPADQHALLFPRFQALVEVLDEAGRLGEFGLEVAEGRSAGSDTRRRYERQLCLELSALARALGPLAVESVAITGSDPYLRRGSDLALVFRAPAREIVERFVVARQAAAIGGPVQEVAGTVAGFAYRGVVEPGRSISSYAATLGEDLVVTNSLVQLERLALVAAGQAPALSGTGEYRFFRRRYAVGAEGESAFLVLPDAAIRRWCSPRWRIAGARIARAAAALAEEHADHMAELLAGAAPARELGPDPDFPDLGALRLTSSGVHSPVHGTLDFLTPVAELPLEKVTAREADLYRTWREGYQEAWSNFFDPIAARIALDGRRTALDLTVKPLIFGTRYADLRELTRGPGLVEGSGDPHPEALVHFALALDPQWETFRTVGMSLGGAADELGAELVSWLGGWAAVSLDDSPLWDEVLQAEGFEEALEVLQDQLGRIPLVVTVAVASPLKLALFLTSLRAFVDGTAPGMTEWRDRAVGERRFVQVGSPGLSEGFSLYYATTPAALILALDEATLLRAMERAERRAAGAGPPALTWPGAHARLELHFRGLELLELLTEGEVAAALQRDSWRNLSVLNEWKRLQPGLDPVEVHRRVFREELACPGGGSYRWNPEWHTMESSVFGHPGEPRPGLRHPAAWDDLARVAFGLFFEEDGLRVRAELEKK